MPLIEQFLSHYAQSLKEGNEWANEFGFSENEKKEDEAAAEGSFYAIFRAIRHMDTAYHKNDGSESEKLLGLSGTPFYIPASLLAKAEGGGTDNGRKNQFSKFFDFHHLANALEEDFLDAQVGSTDNRKGWQVKEVSQPTGSSFEDARMTLAQVKTAMESGTIIFNNIGAHIPRLAGATLASTDALSLPGALNMYVTAKGMRTSAPPHTDRQDVLVVQMEGAKRWRVFTPPTDGNVKPTADPFARGKGEDSLPLHTLLEGKEGRLGTELLMDVVTREGDVLFIPAGFPHTTDTVEENADYDTSIHLTFNIDTHVWDLDHLSVRQAALRRGGVKDVLAPSVPLNGGEANRYIGNVNQMLDGDLRSELMDALPLDFLDEMVTSNNDDIVARLEKTCSKVNEVTGDSTAAALSPESFQEALAKIHTYGSSILDIHRDMYLAAVEEGRLRKAEAAMTAHVKNDKVAMTPERMQRLSLFRVRTFFEQIEEVKKELEQWCVSGTALSPSSSASSSDGAAATASTSQLDPNWQFTAPLNVGDEVEADLGGAFFAAKISQVVGNTYNVVFFDGDRANGLDRSEIKLLTPPSAESEEFDTTGLTKKEIKRLKKKMEKKKRK